MKKFTSLLFSLLTLHCWSQVVTVDPVFPKEQDSITITFDATKGNAGLLNETVIYAHTGVVTTLSPTSASWKNVVGNWATADARVKMKSLGGYKWSIRFKLKDFYTQAGTFAAGEKILKMGFVFRNLDGSKKGANANGSDIFIDVYENTFAIKRSLPEKNTVIQAQTDSTKLTYYSSQFANNTLTVNGNVVLQQTSNSNFNFVLKNYLPGQYVVKFTSVYNTQTLTDSFTYIVNPVVQFVVKPAGTEQGVTLLADSILRFALFAPNKQNVYVLLEKNNYEPRLQTFMKYDPSSSTWWVEFKAPTGEFGYQYLVDGNLRVADPFSRVMLNEWDDAYIPSDVYPNLKPYPKDKTTGWVSLYNAFETPYPWTKINFERPNKEKLVIYEMLIRDFVGKQSFKTIEDSIPYLKKLGINVLQLMPIMEFEGNLSWGYNIASHMSLDKYYGTRNALKSLIDKCHANQIAVVLDVVYNHAFSTASICQLYWDQAQFKPTTQNPWVNPDAKHPYNVGYDLNHASGATNIYVKQTLKYWLNEFRVDGFRFDLSKGFTQNNTGSDVNAWSQYDASRINILKDYHNFIQTTSPNAYTILEHFAANNEEKELADAGMMLWGNGNSAAQEAVMGFLSNSDFGYGISNEYRGWSKRHLVGYIESHDEERLSLKAKDFGNGSSRNLDVYTRRMATTHAIFSLTPGPKMLWQFQELAYDFSINRCSDGTSNTNCRTDAKPVKWDYLNNKNRKGLYLKMAAMHHLKTQNNAVGWAQDYELITTGQNKTLTINHPDFNTFVATNFGTLGGTFNFNFPNAGKWFNYITGDSITLSQNSYSLTIGDGDFQIYTSKKVNNPLVNELKSLSQTQKINIQNTFNIYPNPSSNSLFIQSLLPAQVSIYSMQGSLIQKTNVQPTTTKIPHNLAIGTYIIVVQNQVGSSSQLFVMQ